MMKSKKGEIVFGWLFSKKKEVYPKGTPKELIEAHKRKRFDQIRHLLQQTSYGMLGEDISQKKKDDFKEIMTFFASEDPLYKEVLEKLLPVIKEQKGILQSKIYPFAPEYNQESIRYVLYFAHQLEDIVRVKKGRSYSLYIRKEDIEK